jgi:hypothetical protein
MVKMANFGNRTMKSTKIYGEVEISYRNFEGINHCKLEFGSYLLRKLEGKWLNYPPIRSTRGIIKPESGV